MIARLEGWLVRPLARLHRRRFRHRFRSNRCRCGRDFVAGGNPDRCWSRRPPAAFAWEGSAASGKLGLGGDSVGNRQRGLQLCDHASFRPRWCTVGWPSSDPLLGWAIFDLAPASRSSQARQAEGSCRLSMAAPFDPPTKSRSRAITCTAELSPCEGLPVQILS